MDAPELMRPTKGNPVVTGRVPEPERAVVA